MATVLIVDDDADHRELLSLTLERDGHQVVLASDVPSALTALQAGGIDAALLDVRMPGESGIDLCRRLRADPATEHLPLMLISADVNDQRVTAGLQAGADDFVPKPFQRAELRNRLASLLRRRQNSALPSRHPGARPQVQSELRVSEVNHRA